MKYYLQGSHVQSANDGDIHYVTADKLVHLYNVPRKDCVFEPHQLRPGESYVVLTPRHAAESYRTLPAPRVLKGIEQTGPLRHDTTLIWE